MKSAIIIIDMLNDFFETEGLVLKKKKASLVKNINNLVEFGRKKKMLIIWIRQEFNPDLSDAYLFMKKTGKKTTIRNTPGAQILDELKREGRDKVIVKNRYSAFFKTDLDKALSKYKIDTVILSGINTHACVRMTAIDAYQRDLRVVLAKDCVASWDNKHHEITLRYLDKSMGIEVLSNRQIYNYFN